ASIPASTTEPEVEVANRRSVPGTAHGAGRIGVDGGPAAAASHAARAGARPLRVRLQQLRVATVPVLRPFPDVPGHVERAERTSAVGKAPHRSRRLPAVVVVVHPSPALLQLALCQCHGFAPTRVQPPRARCPVAPRIYAAVSAARRVLPL